MADYLPPGGRRCAYNPVSPSNIPLSLSPFIWWSRKNERKKSNTAQNTHFDDNDLMVWPVLACNVHKTNTLTPGIRAFSLSVLLMVSRHIGLTVMNLKFKISSAHTTTYTASVWPVTGAGPAATPRTDGSEINFRKLLNSSSASLGRQRIKTGPPVVWWSHCRKKHRSFVHWVHNHRTLSGFLGKHYRAAVLNGR